MLSLAVSPAQWRTGVLSDLTVAPALVAEAIAFARVAQLHPPTGATAPSSSTDIRRVPNRQCQGLGAAIVVMLYRAPSRLSAA